MNSLFLATSYFECSPFLGRCCGTSPASTYGHRETCSLSVALAKGQFT